MKTKEKNSWANFFLENGFVEPINSSSTGICLLALAIERYIFVCKATSAQTLLSKKRHIILCAFSTCSILISFSAILIRMISEHNCVSNSHEQLCFNLPNNIWISALLEIIFLFLVPASICVVLYYKVAKTLKARRRNDDVNRRLNIGFTVTCAAWILFWIPSEILHFVYYLWSAYWQFFRSSGIPNPSIRLNNMAYHLKLMYSMANPLILLLISPPFQAPVKNATKKFKTYLGRNE